MKAVRALIIDKIALGPGYYRFELLAPEIAEVAKPGQFIEIFAGEEGTFDPLLPRPISIYRINVRDGIISIIFKEVGRGTRLLANKNTGEILNSFGPVGNGFSILSDSRKIALIAGGIGMPPLYSFAETLSSYSVTLFYGARSQSELFELESWANLNISVFAATDDGSYGHHGLVTDLFLEKFKYENYDFIAACGPKPMLNAVQDIALNFGIPGQLSLESHMACGVGACLGCSCTTQGGCKRVCVDGPGFDLKEVIFNAG